MSAPVLNCAGLPVFDSDGLPVFDCPRCLCCYCDHLMLRIKGLTACTFPLELTWGCSPTGEEKLRIDGYTLNDAPWKLEISGDFGRNDCLITCTCCFFAQVGTLNYSGKSFAGGTYTARTATIWAAFYMDTASGNYKLLVFATIKTFFTKDYNCKDLILFSKAGTIAGDCTQQVANDLTECEQLVATFSNELCSYSEDRLFHTANFVAIATSGTAELWGVNCGINCNCWVEPNDYRPPSEAVVTRSGDCSSATLIEGTYPAGNKGDQNCTWEYTLSVEGDSYQFLLSLRGEKPSLGTPGGAYLVNSWELCCVAGNPVGTLTATQGDCVFTFTFANV